MTAGQISDFTGARKLFGKLEGCGMLLADKGYDADWLRQSLKDRGIAPCIPPKSNRKEIIYYNKEEYKKRHKIENMFSRIKDWRKIAMRYERCAHTFFSAICIAAAVIFYL